MDYRRLPNTDFDVPVLTLGTGTFGGSHDRSDAVSRRTKTYPYWHQDINPQMKSQLF